MAWSYSGNPSSSDLDMVRFLIGDTDADNPQLDNAEITAMLTRETSAVAAAIACVHVLRARYSRLATSKSIGDLSISYARVADNYEKLAASLQKQLSLQLCQPKAGSISQADKTAMTADTDRVPPRFTIGVHDYEY